MYNSTVESMKFPQYRKYKNNQAYFKIISDVEFEEIKRIGKKSLVTKVIARQYPEKVFISDLLVRYADFADVISEAEYLKAGSANH